MVAVALALINAITWNGQPWALWPAGGILIFILLGRLRATPG
jgi:hypothetical protein